MSVGGAPIGPIDLIYHLTCRCCHSQSHSKVTTKLQIIAAQCKSGAWFSLVGSRYTRNDFLSDHSLIELAIGHSGCVAVQAKTVQEKATGLAALSLATSSHKYPVLLTQGQAIGGTVMAGGCHGLRSGALQISPPPDTPLGVDCSRSLLLAGDAASATLGTDQEAHGHEEAQRVAEGEEDGHADHHRHLDKELVLAPEHEPS